NVGLTFLTVFIFCYRLGEADWGDVHEGHCTVPEDEVLVYRIAVGRDRWPEVWYDQIDALRRARGEEGETRSAGLVPAEVIRDVFERIPPRPYQAGGHYSDQSERPCGSLATHEIREARRKEETRFREAAFLPHRTRRRRAVL